MVIDPKTAAEIAEHAAHDGGHVKTADLVGTTFRVDGYETVETKYGDRLVAEICRNGDAASEKAWLSGVVLDRQLEALADAGQFPIMVRLERADERWYKLVVIDGPPA